uniref:RING-type domain-containing protein n=1 Tax=Clytia hemisphaerica TaxID=252671 RepID=A0A7M5V2I1_9CNID
IPTGDSNNVATTNNNVTSTSSNNNNRVPARRGNATSQFGCRAIPSFKRKNSTNQFCLPSKKKMESITKTISVSDVKDDKIFTYYEVPINLADLQEINVRTIQREVRAQIGGDDFILTNKKGNPVRDMPNTRGLSNWNNKAVIRAVNSTTFRKWKPEMWKLIKKDYCLIDDTDDESEDEDDFLPPMLNLPSPPSVSDLSNILGFQTAGVMPVVTNNDLLKELIEIKDKVNENLAVQPTEPSVAESVPIVQQVLDCFKCSICLEPKFSFIFCIQCKRSIVCSNCVNTQLITRCPLCRSVFEHTCSSCNETNIIQPTPVSIVGLEEVLMTAITSGQS